MGKSELEAILADQLIALGIRPADKRHDRTFITGRKYEADFLWFFPKSTCFRGLVVEVQGGIFMPPRLDKKGVMRGRGHANPKSIQRDAEKMCLAQLDGWMIFFVTADMIKDGRAAAWIEEALLLG